MSTEQLLAIDIGAGLGTKLGLFEDIHTCVAEDLLPVDAYGETTANFTDALAGRIEALLTRHGGNVGDLAGIGIACAGILQEDGAFQLVQNLSHWNGFNLKADLAERYDLPVAIENDANAGGLAEWSVLRIPLIYWVLGGGWGGAWISAQGAVRFPARDWDGHDTSLHYSNEPGYAIPLEKLHLKGLFHEVGASYERFERVLIEDFDLADKILTGPGGSPDHLRAEVILSGPGRCRLFRAVVGDDDFYERFLDIHESKEMSDPSIAGRHISKLSSMRVEAAVQTDRLFGKVLAAATRLLLKQAETDGLPAGVPICLGGKPSYALPYFGPSAQRALGRMGFMNYLRPSVLDERGSNANLVGAAVLADQARRNGS